MRELLKQSGIYQIRNTVNGKIYVGSAKRLSTRRNGHFNCLRTNKHPNSKLQRAWNKYGAHAFAFEPLITCAPSMLIRYEQQFIDQWKPAYNIRTVAESNAGLKYTPEQLLKLKERSGRPEYRAAMSAAKMGCLHTDDAKARISAGMKKVTEQPGWRANISAAHTGKKRSEQMRKNISANKVKYYSDPANKAKASIQGRNLSSNKRYTFEGNTLTITEWSEKTGISNWAIIQRLAAGWSIERTLTTQNQKTLIEHAGIQKSVTAWATQYGLKEATLRRRLKSGWSMEKALTHPVRWDGK